MRHSFHSTIFLSPLSLLHPVKELIHKKKGYPIDDQTLKFGKDVLQDDNRLSDCESIASGARIDISLASIPISVLDEPRWEEAILFVKASDQISKGQSFCEGS